MLRASVGTVFDPAEPALEGAVWVLRNPQLCKVRGLRVGVELFLRLHERHRPPLRAFLRYFLGLGTWGFGGPIATVGYMQRDLVEDRDWLERQDFLDGVALGQTMPGPLAAQVSMWVGYLVSGAAGALAVAGAFILPSFVFVLGVAVLYVHYQGLSVVQSIFYGVAPAVMAIIAIAAWKLARLTDGKDRRLWAPDSTQNFGVEACET